ncbi:unnamed protein product [marine sediment metagenome]|uniref:Ribbon-helix-helix protein CopG domain-containing protein n=1 Tax=marine sediment metagenome TaxID=412755 RepID=X1BBP7_9ZZZZ
MHRSQILLKESQYKILKELSEKKEKSLSGLIREIIDVYLQGSSKSLLSSIAGIIEDNEVNGKDHDSILYE